MIYWTKKTDVLGEYESVKTESCLICSEHNKPLFKMERMYALLYGFLPIAPLKIDTYKICVACKTKLKLKTDDSNLQMVYEHVPAPKKLKYLWGWFVIVTIVLLITWLILTITSIQPHQK